jgi:hypothetical protein
VWQRLSDFSGRRRLLLWSLALAMVAAVSMAFVTYRSYQSAAADLVIQRDGQLAQLSAARLSTELNHSADSLYALARTPAMVNGLPHARLDELAAAALRLVVFDGGVVLLDNHGLVQGASPPRAEIVGSNWSNRETFRQVLLKSDTSISNATSDGPGGSRVIAIGVPILGPNSEFKGALIGQFLIDGSSHGSFYASIVRLRLAQSGSVIVTDGTDLVIYSTVPDEVGTVRREPELPAVVSAPSAAAGRAKDESGKDIVSAYAPVPGTTWNLITQDDWSVLTSSTRRYRDLFFASILVAALLPTLGTALLTRQRRLRLMSGYSPDGDDMVRAVQRKLAPNPMPMLPGWTSTYRHRLKHGTQQEIIDLAFLEDGRLMIALGRVESSGVDAVLALAATHTLWRFAVDRRLDPSDALIRANRTLCAGFTRALRVSCVYALVDPLQGSVDYASAGHAAPFVSGGESTPLTFAPGAPLGEHINSSYVTAQMELGDARRLLFLSQAMCTAQNIQKETFGQHCLPDVLAREPGHLESVADSLITEFDRFVHNSPHEPNEVSFLILQRLGDET